MADQQQLEILKQGVEAWNKWRKDNPGVEVDLSGANLRKKHLELVDFNTAHLEGAKLPFAHLEGADLRYAFFDRATNLDSIFLGNEEYGVASVVDVRWGDVNLGLVNWEPIQKLGEEQKARQAMTDGKKIDKKTRLREYRRAVRANRQLAVVLREQGLNEEADHFAYRAQCLQRVVWRRQQMWLKFVFSWFLYLLAGYGYRPLHSIVAYMLLISGFAVAFYALGHLAWYEALVVSLTAFHGRGFFSQQYQPGDPQSIIAAFEAVVGLVIEISFIATFTQRFFGR